MISETKKKEKNIKLFKEKHKHVNKQINKQKRNIW